MPAAGGRCADCLAARRATAIHDAFLHDDHSGPLYPALFSVALMVMTEGRNYSGAEYKAWLTAAGLSPGEDAADAGPQQRAGGPKALTSGQGGLDDRSYFVSSGTSGISNWTSGPDAAGGGTVNVAPSDVCTVMAVTFQVPTSLVAEP